MKDYLSFNNSFSNAVNSAIQDSIKTINNTSGSSNKGKNMYQYQVFGGDKGIIADTFRRVDSLKGVTIVSSDIEELLNAMHSGCNRISDKSRRNTCNDYVNRKTNNLRTKVNATSSNGKIIPFGSDTDGDGANGGGGLIHPPTTTTPTTAGFGTGNIIGIVLLAGVVIGFIYMGIKGKKSVEIKK